MFIKKPMGMQCEDNPDGSRVCKRFKVKDGRMLATGTDVELIPDPSSGCRVREVGNVLGEDREAVDMEIARVESKCKRGI